jgi:hypothetical protein
MNSKLDFTTAGCQSRYSASLVVKEKPCLTVPSREHQANPVPDPEQTRGQRFSTDQKKEEKTTSKYLETISGGAV